MNSKKTIPVQSWVSCLILWLMFALNANGREILNRLMPYITDEYSISATEAGLSVTVASVGVMLASMMVPLFDKRKGYKRRTLLIFFSIGYMLFTLLCGFRMIAGVYGVFLVLQFIRGFFSGAGDANEVGNVTEWFPKEKAGIALGVQHSGYPWGTLIGGLLITGALGIFGDAGWRKCFFIFPVIGIFVWIALALYWKKENYQKFEDATRANGWTPPLDGAEEPENSRGAVRQCLKNPNVMACTVGLMLAHIAYYGFSFWMPLYLSYVSNFDYAAAAGFSTIYTITAGLGQIIWGGLSDKVGSKRCLLIMCLWYAAALAIMPMISRGMFWLVFCQLFLGCASNALFVVFYNLLANSTRPGTQISSMGVANTGLYFGAAVGAFLCGRLIDLGGGVTSVSGYMVTIYILALMLVIVFLVVLFFARETQGKRVGRDFALLKREKYYIVALEQAKKEGEQYADTEQNS